MLPPPKSASFIIAVAVLTFIVVSPFDLLFYIILNGVCSRRPVLEIIGVNSFNILGGEAVDSLSYDRDRQSSGHHLTNDDESQITAILVSFRHFQHRWKSNRCSDEEIIRMTKIAHRIGLTFNSEKELMLQYLAALQSGDNIRACIGNHVRKSKAVAANILRNMNRQGDDSSKSTYLLQNYILEHFDFISQLSLKREFKHFCVELSPSIHPVLWLVGWIFVIACILFFVAWILQWGLQADASAISSWGINLALNIINEIFLISLLRIFFINILVIKSARPMLQKIHLHLRSLDHDVEVKKIEVQESTIEHYLRPSLIAARDPTVSKTEVAKILGRTSDSLEYNLRISCASSTFTRPSIDDGDRTEV